MNVIIIPQGNEDKYMKIAGAGNLEAAGVSKQVLREVWNIAGNPEAYILGGLDDWDGDLSELRKMTRKQERINKGTLISRLITYLGRRKNVSI